MWEHPNFLMINVNRSQRQDVLTETRLFLEAEKIHTKTGTINELIDLWEADEKKFAYKMRTHAARIVGTPEYWHAEHRKLKSIIMQLGSPSIFLTFSCADLHNRIMQSHMHTHPDCPALNVSNNPNVVCEVFVQQLKDLFKNYLDKVMDIIWKWLRYEFQNRYTIHAHGLIKVRNEPHVIIVNEKGSDEKVQGLTNLGQIAINGFEMMQAFEYVGTLEEVKEAGKITENEFKDLERIRRNRYAAEKALEEWTNNLHIIGQKFSKHKSEQSRQAKKRMFDFVPNSKDLADLSSTVMSHKCNKETCSKKGKCKAGFPKEETPRAKCVYTQTFSKKTKQKVTML